MKFNLRLPADLMATLRRCAADNGRSINAEIIWRLRRSLDGYRQ
jgi:hypothetical protein